VFKYPDNIKDSLTAVTNVATRSRIVWLQMKVLTVFLAACLCIRRLMSIARLAMKPEIHKIIRKAIMTSSVDDEWREVMPISEVVPHGLSEVYVVSSNGGRDVADRPTMSLAIVARIRRSGADKPGLLLKGKSN